LPADATHEVVVVVLIEVVHDAIVEVHDVGVDAIVLGRRPIEVGLSVGIPTGGAAVSTAGIYAELIKYTI